MVARGEDFRARDGEGAVLGKGNGFAKLVAVLLAPSHLLFRVNKQFT